MAKTHLASKLLLTLALLCGVALGQAVPTTTHYNFNQPPQGYQPWGALINANFGTLDTLLFNGLVNQYASDPSPCTGKVWYNTTEAQYKYCVAGSPALFGTVTNGLTFNNGGTGSASGVVFDGSAPYTISYNTLGAVPVGDVNGSGVVTKINGTSLPNSSTYVGTNSSGQIVVSVTPLLPSNNLSDLSSAATALGNLGGAPLASPTFTGLVTFPITGATAQCLHVNTAGQLSGTGADCGSGGGGGSPGGSSTQVQYNNGGVFAGLLNVAAGSLLASQGSSTAPVFQTKAIYDVRDYGWNCNGTAYNNFTSLKSAIGSTFASVYVAPNCGVGNDTVPSNIILDFADGGSLKTLTDTTTPLGQGLYDTTAGATGACNGSGASCTISVTAPANDTYAVMCGRGFSGGALKLQSSVLSDIVLSWPGSNAGFSAITQMWTVSNVTAGARTFTATSSGSHVGSCSAVPISGLGPTPVLVGTSGICSNVSPNSPYSCTGTFPAGAFALVFGSQNNTSETCGTPTSGFTIVPGAAGCSTATGSNLAVAYLNSTSSGSLTGTIPFSPSPAGHFWAAQIVALAPGSGHLFINGGIHDPDNHQIFLNAAGTSSQGAIDFSGAELLDRVIPEWWGAGYGVAATTNTQALQAAIWGAFGNSPSAARVSGSLLNYANRPLYLTTQYNINGELQLFNLDGFNIQCSNRLTSGITQTASNSRIFNAQAITYGLLGNCAFASSASSTTSLITIDQASGTTPADLKPQFIDFLFDNFGGNCQTAQGVLLAPSGGGAQGSNVNFYDPEFNCFTSAALQVGTSSAFAQNALAITVYNGDFQGNNANAFADYGGGYIQFFGTTMENGGFNGSTQTGYDFYCNAPQGPVVLYDVRSESENFFSCDQGEIYDSRTIAQAQFINAGSSYPVGTQMTGLRVTGDGAYYKVTSDTGPTIGVGGPNSQQIASSGTTTSLTDTNQTTTGSVTVGTFSSANIGETLTQATSGATATRLNNPSNSATVSGTLVSGAISFGDTVQQTVTAVTCTAGSGNSSTAFNCSNFSGAADGTHAWTDNTSSATFTPSGTPVFAAASPVLLMSAASGTPDNHDDWVSPGGVHYTPTAVPANEANWATNAFVGMQVGIWAGTDVNCKGTITSNSAQTLNFSAGLTTIYPYTLCSSSIDSTSTYIVEPLWNHGTVIDGGVTLQYVNFNVIQGDSSSVSFQGRIQDSYFAGGQFLVQGGGASIARSLLKNVTSTRQDWFNGCCGNTPGGAGNNIGDWDVEVLLPGATQFANWSLPHIGGGGMFASALHESMGTKAFCWEIGTVGTNLPPANTTAAETCIGGRSDYGAGSDNFRNRVELFSGTNRALLGPGVTIGLNSNGVDLSLAGAPSTGSGMPGGVKIMCGVVGSSGTGVNSGNNCFGIDYLGNISFLLSKGQHFNTQASNSDTSGSCTMSAGACTAITFTTNFAAAPSCQVTWTGTGTLTGILSSNATTSGLQPKSSVNTDTAQVSYTCTGNPN